MARRVGLKINSAKTESYDGRKLGFSRRITRFYWYNKSISSAVNIKLFRACVESTLLYNAVTWIFVTDTVSRKLDGCYTKLIRYALNQKWSDYVPNNILYNCLEFVTIRLLEEKQLSFAGHCILSKQPAYQLVTFMITPN
jgi:hypothetical protein